MLINSLAAFGAISIAALFWRLLDGFVLAPERELRALLARSEEFEAQRREEEKRRRARNEIKSALNPAWAWDEECARQEKWLREASDEDLVALNWKTGILISREQADWVIGVERAEYLRGISMKLGYTPADVVWDGKRTKPA